MNDDAIVKLFFARDEAAIAQVQKQYGSLCHAVAMRILGSREDAEECVNDAWRRAWDTIPPQRPKHLRLFLGRITRNRAIDLWRKNNAERRGGDQVAIALEELNECIGSSGSPEQEVDAKQLAAAINGFLQNERMQHRQVFLRRYFYLEDIPTIACRYGLREANVRMMLSRTRQKLRTYLTQEGYL